VTTVGYGDPDVSVTTDGGRIIAIFLMVTGIGFVAVMTTAAAERFVRGGRAEEQAREERLAIEERAQANDAPSKSASIKSSPASTRSNGAARSPREDLEYGLSRAP
jgi:hypothetical protein